jgi:hypothetical protein
MQSATRIITNTLPKTRRHSHKNTFSNQDPDTSQGLDFFNIFYNPANRGPLSQSALLLIDLLNDFFRSKLWLTTWLLFFLSACQSKPEFINHPPPNHVVSMDVFADQTLVANFGCDEIQAPSNLIGGLEPPYPIAICVIQYTPGEGTEALAAEIESGQFVFYTGGLLGSYIRYLIYQNGEYLLLKTEEDLRRLFAPIESPDEALSFVLAAKNLSAYYGLQYDPAYKYEVDTIEDTHVTPDADGYLVHLFHDQRFGCGPHWISEIDAYVSVSGNIEERSSRQSFRNPDLDELCID